MKTSKPPPTLAEMRERALAAVADHERDMLTDPAYRAVADKLQAKRDTAARKAGKEGSG